MELYIHFSCTCQDGIRDGRSISGTAKRNYVILLNISGVIVLPIGIQNIGTYHHQ